MLIVSIAVYFILRKLTISPANEDVETNTTTSVKAEKVEEMYTNEQFIILKRTGKPMTSSMIQFCA